MSEYENRLKVVTAKLRATEDDLVEIANNDEFSDAEVRATVQLYASLRERRNYYLNKAHFEENEDG